MSSPQRDCLYTQRETAAGKRRIRFRYPLESAINVPRYGGKFMRRKEWRYADTGATEYRWEWRAGNLTRPEEVEMLRVGLVQHRRIDPGLVPFQFVRSVLDVPTFSFKRYQRE